MARIIFVEGLQGCGKTTISEWLSQQFTARGMDCAWHKEDAPHPIGMHYMPEEYRDVAAYMEGSTARWSAFAAQEQQEGKITLFDGRLLMCPIWALLRFNVETDKIIGFVRGLAEAVSAMEPLLVYLYAPDYPLVFASMCRRRGNKTQDIYVERHDQSLYAQNRQDYGYDGLVHFELEHKTVTEQLVETLDMPKLTVDITGQEWDAYKERIMQFVGPFLENTGPA